MTDLIDLLTDWQLWFWLGLLLGSAYFVLWSDDRKLRRDERNEFKKHRDALRGRF